MVFLTTAVALIAAAITGAILLALASFPQPFFTLLIFGVAFLAAGLCLRFLREPLALAPQPVSSPSPPPDPHSQASSLERRHHQATAEGEAHQHKLEERRAIRRIREELRDSRRVLGRAEDLRARPVDRFTWGAWDECERILLDHEDAALHSTVSEAYRLIYDLDLSQFKPMDGEEGQIIQHDPDAAPPSNEEIQEAVKAVDRAILALEMADDVKV